MLPGYGIERVGVYQSAKRASVDDEPGDESPKLSRRKDVHLKHGDWVRSNRLVPKSIDAQFGD